MNKRGTVQEIPVIHSIVDVIVVLHNLRKELAQEIVIGSLFETQLPHIVEIYTKFLYRW